MSNSLDFSFNRPSKVAYTIVTDQIYHDLGVKMKKLAATRTGKISPSDSPFYLLTPNETYVQGGAELWEPLGLAIGYARFAFSRGWVDDLDEELTGVAATLVVLWTISDRHVIQDMVFPSLKEQWRKCPPSFDTHLWTAISKVMDEFNAGRFDVPINAKSTALAHEMMSSKLFEPCFRPVESLHEVLERKVVPFRKWCPVPVPRKVKVIRKSYSENGQGVILIEKINETATELINQNLYGRKG